ncbi:MAG: hypothetical protein H2054_10760 [Sphingomonas sp.]|uniref:hypothetical protein n=1 Tax=Sphingomonas sp. TaxID=28214 RepID=UPI0017B275C5|nr:hypothetical protein [Sphingomonas sp.]
MITTYRWAGGEEAMLRFGSGSGPVAIILPPLFEEHNRMRRLMVTMACAMATAGLSAVIPDLPGQGESMTPTENATLEAWQAATTALVGALSERGPPHLASLRGAAILDSMPGTASVWRFAPTPGRAVLNDLRRAEAVSGRRDWSSFSIDSPPAQLVGNKINWALYVGLEAHLSLGTPPVPLRTLRLDSDPALADRKLAGAPLWRRAEPGDDPELARVLAEDLAEWVRRCGG